VTAVPTIRAVFAIGSSLREARLRQGLEYPEIEQATKIRAKHLKALEDEQFELLPAQTYVKGFLRTYAEYLGLDGQLYVDEFNSRYATGEDEPAPIARRNIGRQGRRIEPRPLVFALLGIAAVTALVVVAATSGRGKEQAQAPTPKLPATTRTTRNRPAKPKPKPKPAKPVAPRRVRVVVTASQGASWIEAHAGSATGEQLYEGTLEQGQTLSLPRKGKLERIWMNVGQPASLSWKLNGNQRPPPGTETAVFVVTAKGIRQVSPAA
jgi:cytoskeletal protein RodZ